MTFLFSGGKGDSEKLSFMPKVTQLVRGRDVNLG